MVPRSLTEWEVQVDPLSPELTMSCAPTATQVEPPAHETAFSTGVEAGSAPAAKVEPLLFEMPTSAFPLASAPTATQVAGPSHEIELEAPAGCRRSSRCSQSNRRTGLPEEGEEGRGRR